MVVDEEAQEAVSGFYGYLGGLNGFGQVVEWTREIGPAGLSPAPGLPITAPRLHSLGPIYKVPRPALPDDAAAAAAVRAFPSDLEYAVAKRPSPILRTGVAAAQHFPSITAALVREHGTRAGQLSRSEAYSLEKAKYPERWRGPAPAFDKLAEKAHGYLYSGKWEGVTVPAIPLPDGRMYRSAGAIDSELSLYLQSVPTGQIKHPAVESQAFRDALYDSMQLAHLVKNLRQGHGDAWRQVHSAGAGDFAWMYTDETGTGTLAFPPGWHSGYRTTWTPGPAVTRLVTELQQSIHRNILALRAELAANMAPDQPLPKPPHGLTPATPAARRNMGLFVLATAAAAAVYFKWSRPLPGVRRRRRPIFGGRAPRKVRGTNGRVPKLQLL